MAAKFWPHCGFGCAGADGQSRRVLPLLMFRRAHSLVSVQGSCVSSRLWRRSVEIPLPPSVIRRPLCGKRSMAASPAESDVFTGKAVSPRDVNMGTLCRVARTVSTSTATPSLRFPPQSCTMGLGARTVLEVRSRPGGCLVRKTWSTWRWGTGTLLT